MLESKTNLIGKFKLYLWGEGNKRKLTGFPATLYKTIAFFTAIYIFWAIIYYPQPILHRSLSFGLFLALTFMTYTMPGTNTRNRIPWYDWFLAFLSVAVSIYIYLNLERVINRLVFVDPVFLWDMIMGIITVLLLLEGTRRVIGPWLSFLSIISLVYLWAGPFIPGKFGHKGFSSAHAIEELFLTTDGIWGNIMGVATNEVILFVIFGAFLLFSGAGAFLFDFAAAIAGWSRGGLAKVAILASGLFGMISGSPVANASTVGVITIPMMKKSGYPGDFAASVETCASAGGILMPPVMGSVAFVMAEVIGIPYVKVATAVFLPAVLYFLALYFSIDFRARKIGLQGLPKNEIPPLRNTIKQGLPFFIPILYLIFRLTLTGATISRVGLESICLIIVISIFNKKSRMNLKMIFEALADGTEKGIMIVTTMASCGIMIGVFNLTGIGGKFSSVLMSLSDSSLIITLILVMLLAMFLGLAMNISTAYLLTAVVAAPVLINLGVTVLAAHMFILFYAAMATITPPVAITAFAAASIAGEPPMKVGFMAMRMAIIAYVLPFIFVYWPALLMQAPFYEIIIALFLGVIAVALIAMGLEGWWFEQKVSKISRLLIIIAGIIILTGNIKLILISSAIVFIINYLLSKSYATK
ncbi:MAG TPA: TRAP transporter fused permease subunit [Syntrophomonadaceae bacterium]|nr:TRAP transporter fused permease subunit [Syntrophomonadaceae bacterium]